MVEVVLSHNDVMAVYIVGQKLNENRVPVNTSVKLRFKRSVPKDENAQALNSATEVDLLY